MKEKLEMLLLDAFDLFYSIWMPILSVFAIMEYLRCDLFEACVIVMFCGPVLYVSIRSFKNFRSRGD